MAMTPEEFAEQMRHIVERSDKPDGIEMEMRHIAMDDAMCDLLTELGYEDGVKIFLDTSKWYA